MILIFEDREGGAIHIVGDRLAAAKLSVLKIVDLEGRPRNARSSPAFALSCLEAFEHVEEGNGRGGTPASSSARLQITSTRP